MPEVTPVPTVETALPTPLTVVETVDVTGLFVGIWLPRLSTVEPTLVTVLPASPSTVFTPAVVVPPLPVPVPPLPLPPVPVPEPEPEPVPEPEPDPLLPEPPLLAVVPLPSSEPVLLPVAGLFLAVE